MIDNFKQKVFLVGIGNIILLAFCCVFSNLAFSQSNSEQHINTQVNSQRIKVNSLIKTYEEAVEDNKKGTKNSANKLIEVTRNLQTERKKLIELLKQESSEIINELELVEDNDSVNRNSLNFKKNKIKSEISALETENNGLYCNWGANDGDLFECNGKKYKYGSPAGKRVYENIFCRDELASNCQACIDDNDPETIACYYTVIASNNKNKNKNNNDIENNEKEFEIKDDGYKNCENPEFLPEFTPKVFFSSTKSLETAARSCKEDSLTLQSPGSDLKKVLSCLQNQLESCVTYLKCKSGNSYYIRPSTCSAKFCKGNLTKEDAKGCVGDLARAFKETSKTKGTTSQKIKILSPTSNQ